jgi:dTDP-4-amino-4,6-dideoxygalactose transaminase
MISHRDSIPMLDLGLQHRTLGDKLLHAIQEAIASGQYTLGQAVNDFEISFATACGTPFGVGVASETDAITLGLQSCGIGKGDDVLMPAHAPISTLLGVVRSGAMPLLVDCDLETGLIDLMSAEKRITPRTRAIVPVHLYGQMVSPQQLLGLASTYDVMIFEDASHAPFAERDGYRAGSVGMAAAFSFHPDRPLSALGDAAIVVTRESIVAQTVRSLRNYGALQRHYHTELGADSRMDTLQAAVLNVKLPYLPVWMSDRQHIAQQYDQLFQPLTAQGLVPLVNHCGSGHAYHSYVVRVTHDCPHDRTSLQTTLAAQGIQTAVHYPSPHYLQPAFKYLGYQLGDFPNTETLCHDALLFPIYPGLSTPQIQTIGGVVTALVSSPTAIELHA